MVLGRRERALEPNGPRLPRFTAALSLVEQPCRRGVASAEPALLRIRALRRIAQPGGPTAGGKRIDRTGDLVAAKHNEEMTGADTPGLWARRVVPRTIQKVTVRHRGRVQKCHRTGRRLGECQRPLTPAACPSSPEASFAPGGPSELGDVSAAVGPSTSPPTGEKRHPLLDSWTRGELSARGSLRRMSEQRDHSLSTERVSAGLASTFGVLATLLAVVGLFGALSYSVTRRTRGLGLRLALGAPRVRIAGLVIGELATLCALGVLPALPIAYVGSRLIAHRLHGIGVADPCDLAVRPASWPWRRWRRRFPCGGDADRSGRGPSSGLISGARTGSETVGWSLAATAVSTRVSRRRPRETPPRAPVSGSGAQAGSSFERRRSCDLEGAATN